LSPGDSPMKQSCYRCVNEVKGVCVLTGDPVDELDPEVTAFGCAEYEEALP